MFSEPEVQYLKSQRLARIATVSNKGQPDVVPVAFEFDGKNFYVGSHSQDIFHRTVAFEFDGKNFYVGSHSQDIFHRTLKYKNVKDGNKRVALTIDDLESIEPWRPRAIKVYGTAEVVDHKGIFGPGKYLRISPQVSWSFGIKGLKQEGFRRVKTVHSTAISV